MEMVLTGSYNLSAEEAERAGTWSSIKASISILMQSRFGQ
jgi:hypothetical protein